MSDAAALVNMVELGRFRTELGANFARILGYFREDGIKSVEQIEAAMRAQSAAMLVNPAHMLKGEARQFGADPLADLAEEIEVIARNCVERRDTPSDALEHVVQLRPLFEATLELLERESNPLVARRNAFGKRPVMGYER
ncbi:MAG: histidine phosphotransferase [Sphingomonas sp.]|nr:histidine phosphotransferase [Sphingomonas sp.]|tara:strand:- start:2151 stop:2570 length:420 start_codon:yes stop_codon:yes gene_type:complete